MEKRLYVVVDENGAVWAGAGLDALPQDLLTDGAEVGIYLLRRVKKVEITRKLKAIEGEAEEPDTEPEAAPLEPETVPG